MYSYDDRQRHYSEGLRHSFTSFWQALIIHDEVLHLRRLIQEAGQTGRNGENVMPPRSQNDRGWAAWIEESASVVESRAIAAVRKRDRVSGNTRVPSCRVGVQRGNLDYVCLCSSSPGYAQLRTARDITRWTSTCSTTFWYTSMACRSPTCFDYSRSVRELPFPCGTDALETCAVSILSA